MWSMKLFYSYCFFYFLCSIGGQEIVTQSSSDYEELRDAFLQANLPQLIEELPSTTLISNDPSISTQSWYNELMNPQSTPPGDHNSHSTTENPPYWHDIHHNAHHTTTNDPNDVEQTDDTVPTTDYPYWLVTESQNEAHPTTKSPGSSTDGIPPTWFDDQSSWNTGHLTAESTISPTTTIPHEIIEEDDEEDSDGSQDDEDIGGEPIGLAEPTAPAKTAWETVEHVITVSSTIAPLRPHTTGLFATVNAEVQFDSVVPTIEPTANAMNMDDLWDTLSTTHRVTDLGESMSDDDEEDKLKNATTTDISMLNVTVDDAGVWNGSHSTLFNDTFLPGSNASFDGNETLNDFTWNGINGSDLSYPLNTTQRVTDLGESMSDDDEDKLDDDPARNSTNVTTSTARSYSRRIKPTLLPIHPSSRITGDFVLDSSTVGSGVHPDQASHTVLLFEQAVHIYGLIAFGLAVLGTVICCCAYGCCCRKTNRRRQYVVNGEPKGVSDPLLGI